jgi:hypothetical protein
MMKNIPEPAMTSHKAELKKLRMIVDWIGFVNTLDYNKRGELKKFAHDLIYS